MRVGRLISSLTESDNETSVLRLYDHLAETENGKLLRAAYSGIMLEALERRFWSRSNPEGRRVHWDEVIEAANHGYEAFYHPGIYIFGTGRTPLYLGRTTQTILRRLKGRYIQHEYSQCHLARRYTHALRREGLNGIPTEVSNYMKKNGLGKARLKGAVAFAQIGIESIWLLPIPFEEKSRVKGVEETLIPIAEEWNRDRGLRSLLNERHL